ncbi:MAG: hypothetical protein KIT58_00230 [Planctomycetota bacterium]|nr:hypothetical protein [Planctomycetota bacterium]
MRARRAADDRLGAVSDDVPQGNVSKVLRKGDGFTWAGVPLEPYKPTTETYRGVTRRELIGKRGESPRFHLRYFRGRPGRFITYERHF